ncbi:MAG: hypothetical protein GY792_36885 [Gammaproteobacteria bacterium]|nr:hypothetical protein [Gammaproteobacteria bacterium]
MTLQEHCKKDKLTMIALYALVRDCAETWSISLEDSISGICRQAEVNRSQLYERKAQLWEALAEVELAGPGRPPKSKSPPMSAEIPAGYGVREQVLRYRLAHPGAMVSHAGGCMSYSDGFRRFILDLSDTWAGDLESFCPWAEIPYQTLMSWHRRDRAQPYTAAPVRAVPALSCSATAECRSIVQDYARWEGSLREFLSKEAKRLRLAPAAIRRVLTITGMISSKPHQAPRYRGSTDRQAPGALLVTDGKAVEVVSSASGEISHYNWQAMVDQATACHTAVVITDNECAQGVLQAFEQSCHFLGRIPQALIHDNKPIHREAALKEAIEPGTRMIPATPGRAENKAVIEGEFGKYEQAVGTLHLDDSSLEHLKRSAVSECIRAYCAGINQAGRAEFQGKSRQQVLREACPDPHADQAFIEHLHGEHTRQGRSKPLPSQALARQILDAGFSRFELEASDPQGKLRTWLSGRYTPAAIRQGLALFATERGKGRLRGKTAHRYLVKLIQSRQEELDLRAQEHWLLEFAQLERVAWLQELEHDYTILKTECDNACTVEHNLAFRLSEKAVFDGLPLARAFWEDKLRALLEKQCQRFEAVRRHIRRLFDAQCNDRFHLISLLIGWENQLVQ